MMVNLYTHWLKRWFSWMVETIKRNENTQGFEALPRRWVVERTFGWFGRYRRLSKDYEYLPSSSETMLYIVMINRDATTFNSESFKSVFHLNFDFSNIPSETTIDNYAPEVQKTTWALTPGGAINFLAFVGLYIVIPEFILFQPRARLHILKQQRRKITLIAAGLLLCFLVFPPLLTGLGTVIKIANLLPHDILKMALFYSLSLLACVRFSQPKLISLIVLFNSLIMMKAYPWDKYVLPLVVVFWYLKSVGFKEQFRLFKQQDIALVKENERHWSTNP